MGKYAKALTAAILPIVGLGVTFGFVDEAQAQAIGVVITNVITLIGVFAVPNA